MAKETDNLIAEEITLEDTVRVNLIFRKFMEAHSYRELIARKYKHKYFEEFSLSPAIAIAIKYYDKYGKVPTIEVLKSIVKKSLENQEKYNTNAVIASIDSALSANQIDEDLTRASIINIISSRTAYNLIIDNIEKIRNQKDVGYILKELTEIENLRIDDDLGFLYFRELASHFEDLTNPESRMSTGYNRLDKLLNGGWLADGRCLGVILAPVHLGKSLMLSNFAVNVLKQGKFAVVISLEMSEFVYGSRVDAHISGLDVNELQFNISELDKKLNSFKKLNPASELLIKEFPANSINARNLDAYLDKVQKQMNRKIDIVYIDYLTLMNPVFGKDRNMYERGGEIAKDVRALSYKYKCPFITAAQSTRDTFRNETIGMDSIGESIQIAATADVIISLYANESDKASGILNSEILKNRLGGRIGETIAWSVNYSSLRIEEAQMDLLNKSEVNNAKADLAKSLDEEFDDI